MMLLLNFGLRNLLYL